jgi:hypothetical protein
VKPACYSGIKNGIPENSMNEIGRQSKNKNNRDLYKRINLFNKGYQPRTNLVKDENGDLFAHSQNILNRLRNYFSQQLKVHRVGDVRQIEIHTTYPFVLEPSPFGNEIAIVKLENYKSLGNDQILPLLVQVGGESLRTEIHKLINYI